MSLDLQQVDLYKGVVYDNQYTLISGKFVLPVAEDPPTDETELADWSPVVVVKAFAEFRIRTISYAAEKDYSPPRIPSPTTEGPFEFMGGDVTIPLPGYNTAGGCNWKAGVRHVFVETVNSDANSGYVLGQAPMLWQSQTLSNASSVTPTDGFPATVKGSGLGPKLGYNKASAAEVDNPMFVYSESSYYPAILQSREMIDGPDSYNPADLITSALDFDGELST